MWTWSFNSYSKEWLHQLKKYSCRHLMIDFTVLYLIEASDQTLRLLCNSSLYAPLDHSLNVLLLVLLWHGDTSPAWLQLSLCDLHNHRQTLDVNFVHSFRTLSQTEQMQQDTHTCPKTSSLTVKVRSSMSSMSLSFIHCRLWWNSSSRNSRSLRSQGLQEWKDSQSESGWYGIHEQPCSLTIASCKLWGGGFTTWVMNA